ncbi:hypothetical protein OCHUTO_0265 [Orientia chuto str. Dubai]|uniref:Uncharacterized protein n=1 Tax=Orientia chuto str. Dubai TaxID=1359168 RepID=A0A0F3MMA8_9RICK|nr:hypothetical protein OCHUTO_0265 [Orientia chuto str. Dubai]
MCIEDELQEIYQRLKIYSYESNLVQHFESIDRSGKIDNIDVDGSWSLSHVMWV